MSFVTKNFFHEIADFSMIIMFILFYFVNRFALMRAIPFQMKTDDLYWARIKVFRSVYETLRGEEEGIAYENEDMIKIQTLLQEEFQQSKIKKDL